MLLLNALMLVLSCRCLWLQQKPGNWRSHCLHPEAACMGLQCHSPRSVHSHGAFAALPKHYHRIMQHCGLLEEPAACFLRLLAAASSAAHGALPAAVAKRTTVSLAQQLWTAVVDSTSLCWQLCTVEPPCCAWLTASKGPHCILTCTLCIPCRLDLCSHLSKQEHPCWLVASKVFVWGTECIS